MFIQNILNRKLLILKLYLHSQNCDTIPEIFLVGNKVDLYVENRVVTSKQAQRVSTYQISNNMCTYRVCLPWLE